MIRALPSASAPGSAALADEQALTTLRSQLTDAQSQRDQAIRERDAANQKLASIPIAPPMPNPIHDEATKWRIASALHLISLNPGANINGPCEAVIVRYPASSYAEDYALDIKQIFGAIEWKYSEIFAKSTLEKGLSVKAAYKGSGQPCG